MISKKKVRLSDIAKKLNISTVTVSKALSNKEGVSDDLRKEIKELAESMGYQKVSDSGKTTGNVGILIPSHFFSAHFSYYWYLFNFLSKELLAQNFYSIMELITDQDEEESVLPRILKDKKVDGLIILGQVKENYIEEINRNFENFILMDFYTNNTLIDSVSNDNFYCSYIMTNYVINSGHKNLRFVGNFNATTSIKDRFMGFEKALLENNLECDKNLILDDRDQKGNLIEIELPSSEKMPSAFICNNDITAARLVHQLHKQGFKVPDDISVTGFDNFLGQQTISVPLTTVYIKPEDSAKVAADLIIAKIEGRPYIKGRHVVSGSLLIRDSVKNISKK